MTFEESIKRLDEIIKEMESKDIPLERAVALYEEGVKLSAECKKELELTKQKITVKE